MALGCPGVDVEEWRKLNRAPLFPGQSQRWILARTRRDDPGPQALEETTKAVLAKWFSDLQLLTGVGQVVDSVKVLKTSATPPNLAAPGVVKTFMQLAQPPSVRPGPVVFLEVEFAWRGHQTDMPWPVRTSSPVQLRSSAECPTDTDWALQVVFAPLEAPERPKLSDALVDEAREIIEESVSAVLTATWPIWALAGLFFGARALAKRK